MMELILLWLVKLECMVSSLGRLGVSYVSS